jgi:hypothetical protein
VNRVVEKGFTELSQSIDIQDNEEGGHDQNEGVVEDRVEKSTCLTYTGLHDKTN